MKNKSIKICKFCKSGFTGRGGTSHCSEICYFQDHCEPQPQGDKCRMWLGGGDRYGCAHFRGMKKSAHIMSYELFNGEIPVGHQIRHSCHTPWCVNPSHLSTGTSQDNSDDMIKAGRSHMCGNGKRKLSNEDVIAIFCSIQPIDEDKITYKTNRSNIQNIRIGKTWRHVTSGLATPDRSQHVSCVGIQNPHVKLTEDQVIEIYYSQKSREFLSSKYGVTEDTITNIKFGITWKHLTDSLPIVNSRPKKSFKSNLSDDQLLEIYNSTQPSKSLALQYHCDRSLIANIRSKKTARIRKLLS